MRKYLIATLLAFAATFAFASPPFAPTATGTKTVAVSNVSAATALFAPPFNSQYQIELQNAGSVTVFVEFGTSGATAAVATGYPILAGQSKLVTVNATVTYVAALTASSTSTLYVTIGQGE